MQVDKYNCIVICGPTASGKTSISVEIAGKYDCEIISADSRQIYRGMDIGTGKDLHEYGVFKNSSIPFHLIDIAMPDEIYSLYRYLNDFYNAFKDIQEREKVPLICGGSGLYIEAALKHFKIANVPENSVFRESKMKLDHPDLENELRNFSDLYNITDLSSKKRIVRALEIAEFSRHDKIEYSSQNAPEIKPVIFCIRADTESRNSRIDERLHERLMTGMIDEVENLLKKGVTFQRMQMFGLEYKWISKYICGEISYDEMNETLQNEIHRFAKRQMTWFRGMEKRGLKINWIDMSDKKLMLPEICRRLENF